MLIVSQIRTGSSQLVPCTKTTEGDRTKLVKINRPLKIAAGGTLMAFVTKFHDRNKVKHANTLPCSVIKL